MLNDDYKLLASVSVFRELYDSDKNIYDVLDQFIIEVINRKRLFSFSSTEMTKYLNDEYGFKLSEPVVKTSLKHLRLERANGVFKVSNIKELSSGVEAIIKGSEQKQKILFDALFSFLEGRLSLKLSHPEQEQIARLFCDFLIQDSIGEGDDYHQLFNEFILSIERDGEKLEILNLIKEGTLIYEGIRYSGNISEVGSWKTDLCLVLDTEILFAIGGYNSIMYRDLYSELEKYIFEINRSTRKRTGKITLAYLPETLQEINYYFSSAERIVAGLDVLDPTKEAMGQIVNNCYTKADVQQKKTRLFHKFSKLNIEVINYDFYDVENEDVIKYNLEDDSIVSKYASLWNDNKENIYKSLRLLSHTNILRKGESVRGFENCRYILLTQTGRTIKLARTSEIINDGDVPLATTFDFLINRFWFKLNKGFGSDNKPRTIDMIVRARNVLSTIVNNRASLKYDEFRCKYENNEITKDEFVALNNDLRSKLKNPEEIDKDTIGEEIESLEKWDMSEVIEQHHRRDLQYNQAQLEIGVLSDQIKTEKQRREELEDRVRTMEAEADKKDEQLRAYEERNIELDCNNVQNNKIITDMQNRIEELEKVNNDNAEKEMKKKKVRHNIFVAALIICMILMFIIYCYGAIADAKWTNRACTILAAFPVISIVVWLVKKIQK